jgi:undecaprenyl-diphosphatase
VSLLDSLILGVLQGLTEFLPISSSGHLAIGLHLLGAREPEENLAFIVAVHLGSLAAILLFSRREILAMLTSRRRLLFVTIVATIPVAVIGLVFKDLVEAITTNLFVVGACLFGTAGLLGYARRRDTGATQAPDLSWGRAAGVGCAQAAAILPGLSRSGSTLAAGLLAGLEREQALRFSFLLAAPAIGGAGLVLALGGNGWGGLGGGVVLAGAAASFVASLLAMAAMVRVVAKRRLGWFALYCAAAGAFALVLALR